MIPIELTPAQLAAFGTLSLPALGVFGLTLFNALAWPRGREDGDYEAKISVLIPARNEESGIEACIRSVFANRHAVHEVIVCDDQSTDATPEILARLEAEFPRLRVIEGIGLPAGWVGKPHACHRLSEHAEGELFVFVDADVELEPDGIARAVSLLADKSADVVTAVPRQVTGTFFERLILPLLHLTYVAWLPMPLVWLTSDPRFLAANGQLLAIRASTYGETGGYSTVRAEVVDDMALCRLVKTSGGRVVFADGHDMAHCRMYSSPREVWEGFSKNLFEGIGGRFIGLLFVFLLYGVTFVAPYVGVVLGLTFVPSLLVPSAIGVAANVAIRILLAARHSQPAEGIVLHPIAIFGFFAIAWNSYLWNARGEIAWAGRVYASRASRSDAEAEEVPHG